MRRMSFSLTEAQFRARSKTVTRRDGWAFLEPGEHVLGVRKTMGLKKGEKQVVLGEIEVVSVRRERLDAILGHPEECVREGFPGLTPEEFVGMLMAATRCSHRKVVTRIEYRYVD